MTCKLTITDPKRSHPSQKVYPNHSPRIPQEQHLGQFSSVNSNGQSVSDHKLVPSTTSPAATGPAARHQEHPPLLLLPTTETIMLLQYFPSLLSGEKQNLQEATQKGSSARASPEFSHFLSKSYEDRAGAAPLVGRNFWDQEGRVIVTFEMFKEQQEFCLCSLFQQADQELHKPHFTTELLSQESYRSLIHPALILIQLYFHLPEKKKSLQTNIFTVTFCLFPLSHPTTGIQRKTTLYSDSFRVVHNV